MQAMSLTNLDRGVKKVISLLESHLAPPLFLSVSLFEI